MGRARFDPRPSLNITIVMLPGAVCIFVRRTSSPLKPPTGGTVRCVPPSRSRVAASKLRPSYPLPRRLHALFPARPADHRPGTPVRSSAPARPARPPQGLPRTTKAARPAPGAFVSRPGRHPPLHRNKRHPIRKPQPGAASKRRHRLQVFRNSPLSTSVAPCTLHVAVPENHPTFYEPCIHAGTVDAKS